MGLLDLFRPRDRGLSETFGEAALQPLPATSAKRTGYDAGIPFGGQTAWNSPTSGGAASGGRRDTLARLYEAYLACPWASSCVDVTARTVTAGGIQLVPDATAGPAQGTPDSPPPRVQQLQDLLRLVNQRETPRQLLRGIVTDLEVAGDAFVEVVWLLEMPVALYSLDAATMSVLADEHGNVTGYHQDIDGVRTVTFEPRQVIHISMDSLRGGTYGDSTTTKAILPITTWLFTAAVVKETMRKGNPPRIAVGLPLETPDGEVRIWRDQYRGRNLGPGNIGNPIVWKNGATPATVHELSAEKIGDLLATLVDARDTIVSEYGVPPNKVGIIESGNLGGGTGTSQDKTFMVNKVGPIAELIGEQFDFALTRKAFGITGWSIRFGDVDWRDDKVVEDIRELRLKNGSWTLDEYLIDIGVQPVGPEQGGDLRIIVDRQGIVLWSDLAAPDRIIPGTPAAAAAAAAAKPAAAPAQAEPNTPQDEPQKETGAGGRLTEATVDGVMVALYPPTALAAQLAVDGGEPVEDLHVTVAYLGKASELPDADGLGQIVAAWALSTPALQATISGRGLFTAGDTPVSYASVDAPGLPAPREALIAQLLAAGQPVSTAHGYTPHLTLAYADVDADLPNEVFTFDAVSLVVGGQRTDYPLVGTAETDDTAGLTEAELDVEWARRYRSLSREVFASASATSRTALTAR